MNTENKPKINMADICLTLLNEYEKGKVTAIKFSVDASLNNEIVEQLEAKLKQQDEVINELIEGLELPKDDEINQLRIVRKSIDKTLANAKKKLRIE